MHTALCSFDDLAQADRAVDRLVQSGFDRRDIHVHHRGAVGATSGKAGHHSGTERWDTMEREVAVDPSVLARVGAFFSNLFGADDRHGHTSSYTEAVERGGFVVVVDADDDEGADRAQVAMRDLQAGAINVVHRPTRPSLRDIVGSRQGAMPLESAAAAERETSYERERALASDRLDQQRSSDPRDDPTLAPGLRYADKDKPNG
jgi:hypothetical protein